MVTAMMTIASVVGVVSVVWCLVVMVVVVVIMVGVVVVVIYPSPEGKSISKSPAEHQRAEWNNGDGLLLNFV